MEGIELDIMMLKQETTQGIFIMICSFDLFFFHYMLNYTYYCFVIPIHLIKLKVIIPGYLKGKLHVCNTIYTWYHVWLLQGECETGTISDSIILSSVSDPYGVAPSSGALSACLITPGI